MPRSRTRTAAHLSVGALLLAAVALATTGTAEAEHASLEGPPPSVATSVPYRWIPRAESTDTAPSEGALRRRFAGLAEHLEPTGERRLPATVTETLDGIVSKASRRADIAVHARDLTTGAVLYDSGGDTLLNPASNQKVLTSAVALDLLGPDYTFKTRVLRAGRALVLVGQGDPVLDGDDLQAMAVIVAEQVDLGDVDQIIVDDAAFGDRRFGPGLYDPEGFGAAHEAPSGALSVDFNTVEVKVASVAGETLPSVEVDGAGAHVEVRNEASVGRRGFISVHTYAEGDKTIVHVKGSMSRRARPVVVRRRILDPGLHAGTVFAARLAEQWSSEALPVVRGETPAGAESVIVNASAPLSEVLERGLAFSNNFIAEQLLRTMAWRVYDEPGTWDAGVEILEAYWAGLGRDDAPVLENGSGLSRRGRLTAAGLVDVLAAAHRETPALLDALPASGEPGTLRTRLRRSEGRVRAKTGTLYGVTGLTGVLTDRDGAPKVAFSILVNAHHAGAMPAAKRRKVEDKLVYTLLGGVPGL